MSFDELKKYGSMEKAFQAGKEKEKEKKEESAFDKLIKVESK